MALAGRVTIIENTVASTAGSRTPRPATRHNRHGATPSVCVGELVDFLTKYLLVPNDFTKRNSSVDALAYWATNKYYAVQRDGFHIISRRHSLLRLNTAFERRSSWIGRRLPTERTTNWAGNSPPAVLAELTCVPGKILAYVLRVLLCPRRDGVRTP